MNVFDLAARISLDASDYEKGLKDASAKSGSTFGKIQSAAGKIGKTMVATAAAGVAAAAGAVVAIGKTAISSYAQYEQLIGGIEKLYGQSAGKLVQLANSAYEQYGFSANEYMATVTTFSASLVKSLKGDTEAAYKMADVAMKDIADNANTFGTDVREVQSVYSALAKGNYTLLDNLRLGFAGTKEGMKDLIAEANKIRKKKGLKGVLSMDNFADIVEAIHTVQEEMGITGKSAEEASKTLEGSFKSMKAAWENYVAGMADKNEYATVSTRALVETVKTYWGNLEPAIKRFANGFGDFVMHIGPLIETELPKLIEDTLPGIMKGASRLLIAVGKSLPKVAKTVLKTGVNGIIDVVNGLLGTKIPKIKEIRWPTWDEVKAAATVAWDLIKRGVEGLGGLVFGRKEDGSVNWPDWDTVKSAALGAWDKIKGAAIALGTEFGKLVFGTTEKGDVKWPTWDEVKEFAKTKWNEIVKAAAALGNDFAKLIFGTTEKGDVNWPSWEDVTATAKEAWGKIKTAAAALGNDFGALLFGTTEKGDVKWPSWDDVVSAAKVAWQAIVDTAAALGSDFAKLVFGTTEKGDVKWPSWDDVVTAAKTAWQAIVDAAAALGTDFAKLIFGTTEKGDVKWPTWDEVREFAKAKWDDIVKAAANLGEGFGKLVFGTTEKGDVNWPTWDDVEASATKAWNDIRTGLLKFLLGDKWTKDADWGNVGAKVNDIIGQIFEGAENASDTVGGIGGKIFSLIWKGVQEAAHDMGDFLLGLIMGDDYKSGENGTTWADFGGWIWGKIVDGINSKIDELTAEGTFLGKIKEFFNLEDEIDALINPINKAIQIINMLFGTNIKMIGTGVESATDTIDKTAGAVEGTANEAEYYVQVLEQLYSIYGTAADKSSEWQAAMTELQRLIPGVTTGVDSQRDSIETLTSKIRENISAWEAQAKASALAAGMSEQEAQLTDAAKKMYDKQYAKDQAKSALEAQRKTLVGYISSLLAQEQAFGGTVDILQRALKDAGAEDLETADLETLRSILKDFADVAGLSDIWGAAQIDLSTMYGYLTSGTLDQAITKYNNALTQYEASVNAYRDALTQFETYAAYVDEEMAKLGSSASDATTTVSGLNDELSKLPGKKIVTVAIVNDAHAPFHAVQNAKGLNYVPVNDYLTRLHKGEAVLSANQAAEWRNGVRGKLDTDLIANAVKGAITEAMGNMAFIMNGKNVVKAIGGRMSRSMSGFQRADSAGYGR